jgi:multicomponent Na+:H+ antiporter subunit E
MKLKHYGPMLLFVSLFVIWIMLSGRLELSSLVTGGVVSLAIVKLTWRVFFAGTRGVPRKFHAPVKIHLMETLFFFPSFFMDLFRATTEVACIALSPHISIRPGIVAVDVGLRNKTVLVLLANQITLTPGTLTVDVDMAAHRLFIHCLDLKTLDERHVAIGIAAMESRMKRMLE